MDIQLIQRDPITHKISFKLQAKVLTGVSKLIQIVVLSLVDVPGRDALDPEKGAGLTDLVGQNIDPNDSTEIFGEIARRVRKAEKEILDAQIGNVEDPEARLRELQIIEIKNGDQIDEIFVKIRIINEAGRATDVVV